MTSDSFSIGIDFGGTNLRLAAYTPAAGFLETIQMPTRLKAGRDAVVADMCAGIRKLRDKYSAKLPLKGIAIGSPGAHGMAGEVGHINIWPDGAACGCGARGCLEPLASATGVRRRAKELIAEGKSPALAALKKSNPDFTPRDVAVLGGAGDRDAQKIFDEVGLALGRGLAALVNTLNLPLYVVGGGLSSSWNLFSPALFEELRCRSYVFRMTDPDKSDAARGTKAKTYVTLTELGPEAGLLGACILPFTMSPNGA